MHSQVHESAEIGHIGDYSGQDHTDLEIVDGVNGLVKMEDFGLCTRVSGRFLQFVQNVCEGW